MKANKGVVEVPVPSSVSLMQRLGMSSFLRRLVILWLLGAVMAMAVALTAEVVLPEEGQWEGMESHHCDEFCENSNKCNHTMEERPTIQQPVNAYSNMAYIWCGIVPITFFRLDLSTIMYLCSSLLLGISSFMYHASITRFWMNLDSSYTYTYITVLILQGTSVVFGISWRCLSPIMVAILVAMPFIRPEIPFRIDSEKISFAQVSIVAVLATVLVLARIYKVVNHAFAKKRRIRKTTALAYLFSILLQISRVVVIASIPAFFGAVAIVSWNKDREKIWCDPDSKFQWHGVWVRINQRRDYGQ